MYLTDMLCTNKNQKNTLHAHTSLITRTPTIIRLEISYTAHQQRHITLPRLCSSSAHKSGAKYQHAPSRTGISYSPNEQNLWIALLHAGVDARDFQSCTKRPEKVIDYLRAWAQQKLSLYNFDLNKRLFTQVPMPPIYIRHQKTCRNSHIWWSTHQFSYRALSQCNKDRQRARNFEWTKSPPVHTDRRNREHHFVREHTHIPCHVEEDGDTFHCTRC